MMTTIQPLTPIGERYVIEQPLGQGLGSIVLRGRDTTLDRLVAIKQIAPDHALAYRAALAEVARLGHPAFVGVYDSLDQDDQLIIIQEYIDGQAFADLAATQLSLTDVTRIGQEIALALAHAHRLGVIHGDLTPAAILRDQWGAIRINNVALPPDSAYFAAAGTILTDRPWMPIAPDFRDDLRALGVLLYLLLLGQTAPPDLPSGWDALPNEPPPPLRDLIERLIQADHPQVIATAEMAVMATRVVGRQLAGLPAPQIKIPPWELPRASVAGDPPPPRQRRPSAPLPPLDRATHTPASDPAPFAPPVAVGPLPARPSNAQPTWANPPAAPIARTDASPAQQTAGIAFVVLLAIALFLFWLVIGYFGAGLLGR